MEQYTSFDEHVERMRAMGEILVEYNFPKRPAAEEDDVAVLKSREVVVDGYDVSCHYSKSDYDDYLMETVQVFAASYPFLPFSVVCKIGRKFLGNENLALVEMYRSGRKIYCWTVTVTREGKTLPPPFEETKYEDQEYQGFSYRLMNPETVNFY